MRGQPGRLWAEAFANGRTPDQLEEHAQHCRNAENQATHIAGADPRALNTAMARVQHTAEHLAVGQRVKAHDRGNIGTITSYNDRAGTAEVHFISPEDRRATRTFPWNHIEILDPATSQRELTHQAQETLTRLLEPLQEQSQRWHTHLASLGIEPGEADQYQRAADLLRHGDEPEARTNLPPDVQEELQRSLERSRAKLLALARDPHADHIANIAATRPLTQLDARARFCRSVEQEATCIVGSDARALAATADRARHTAEHLAVGQRVKAHDRGNIGTIVDFDDNAGTVSVHFVSPDDRGATRDIPWPKVTILDRNPEPRDLPNEAQATLNQLLEPIREKLERWHGHLASRGVGPLEAGSTERAAELAIDRATGQLTYTQPAWLHHMLGPRPEPALAADAWTQAVRNVAAYRIRCGIPDHVAGLGEPPDPGGSFRQAWEEASAHAVRSRLWLDTYNLQPVTPVAQARSIQELQDRRSELEALFASAPADQRDLIRRLQDGDLSSPETMRLLEDALHTQGARRDWILTHWPHVVEQAEITRTLEAGASGPHLPNLLEGLTQHDGPLGDAAKDNERWLRNSLSHLVPTDATSLDADTVDLLHAIATYRNRWNITHPDPLGQAAETDEQALERVQLTRWIGDTRAELDIQRDAPLAGGPTYGHAGQLAFAYDSDPAHSVESGPLGI